MIYLVAGVVIVLAIVVGACVWSWLGVDREAEIVNLRYGKR